MKNPLKKLALRSSLLLLIAAFGMSTAFAGNPNKTTTTAKFAKEVHTQVTSMIEYPEFNGQDVEAGNVNVVFSIAEGNTIEIKSLAGGNGVLHYHVKKSLQGQALDLNHHAEGSTFSMKIKFKVSTLSKKEIMI